MLSEEDAQKLDAARIGAAIRLAILLLATSSSGALLHDGEATLSVTAGETGASYSIVGTGAMRFSFDKNRTDLFKKLLRNVAQKIDSGHVDAEYAHLLADPGITVDKDGRLTVDASKVQNKAIIYALKGEGNIVEGEAWQHVREKPLQTGNVTVQNRNGRNKQLGGDIAKTVNKLSCPSYFARDKLSKIFK